MTDINEEKRSYPERWGDTPLRNVFDRMVEDPMWNDPFPKMLSRFDRTFFPRIDIVDLGSEIKVLADVPGVNPDNIDIEIKDNKMRISGSIDREEEPSRNQRTHRYERTFGAFNRQFALPASVDEETARATCKDGVLTVTMQKAAGENPKKIVIERQ